MDLTTECESLRREHPQMQIVVSGDLTRMGRGFEFGCAHRFLHAYWFLNPHSPRPFKIGLSAGGDSALTISGNHDFWRMIPFQVSREILEPHFWEMPWLHIIKDNKSGLELHVVGLDSCAGLWRVSVNQGFANGAIRVEDLDKAQKLFQNAGSSQGPSLRVVVVHHPPLQMTSDSMRDFCAWLDFMDVRIILTGHTHQSDTPEDDNSRAGYYELRCGTTLQAGTYNLLPGPECNHFFVHFVDLTEDSAAVKWRTTRFLHEGSSWRGEPAWSTCIPITG